jgi:hypothetical protein
MPMQPGMAAPMNPMRNLARAAALRGGPMPQMPQQPMGGAMPPPPVGAPPGGMGGAMGAGMPQQPQMPQRPLPGQQNVWGGGQGY